ncbi:hypothetical protein D9M72_296430 [compost metagenome]
MAHQPFDETFARHDVDMAARHLLDAVEFGQQLLLLVVLVADIGGQQIARLGGNHAAAMPLQQARAAVFLQHGDGPADG